MKIKVLIIEDNEDDAVLILRAISANGFEVQSKRAWNRGTFVQLLCDEPWDIIICDYNLEGMNATTVLDILEQYESDMPIVIVSGSMTEDQQRAMGKPMLTKDKMMRLVPVIERELKQAQQWDEVLLSWGVAVEMKDHNTLGHSVRVADLSVRLARALKICEVDIVSIRRGAYLHDIGKIMIEEQILLKEGPLDEDEWERMKMHPQIARDILAPMHFLRKAIDIPYCHHERWDGRGYPRGLAGEDIPICARIFTVVDNYDALTSDRPYREAMPNAAALKYIKTEAGSLFDPWIVTMFVDLMKENEQ